MTMIKRWLQRKDRRIVLARLEKYTRHLSHNRITNGSDA